MNHYTDPFVEIHNNLYLKQKTLYNSFAFQNYKNK